MDNKTLGTVNSGMDNQPFFTPGPGEEIDKNDKESIDNINLSNQAAEWSNAENRRAGGVAMESIKQEGAPNQESLGEIIPLDTNQPDVLRPEITKKDNEVIGKVINFGDFSSKGDKISRETLAKITNIVDKYKAGEISPSTLDDAEWEGTRAYVKGSFGRDLAA